MAGKAINGKRNQFTLATKFGNQYGEHAGKVKGTREYVRYAVEKSLERLGVDKIDLYYQHRVDRTIPIEETWEALKVWM